jgi:hypothetical protein
MTGLEGDLDDTERFVPCEAHGKGTAAFVCQHLFSESGLGFNWGRSAEEPDAPCPDAWCDACESSLQQEGEWSERAMAEANIKVVCNLCYEEIRERNWPRNADEVDRLVKKAVPFLSGKQARLMEQFQIDRWDRFDWNQEKAELVFSHGGKPRVIADIVFVGSVSKRSHTWLWSWANASNLEPMKARMREVRDYGEEHRLLKLAGAHWKATEQDGWEMTAVAALLLDAIGAYRSPSDDGFTYMVITDVRWTQ